VNSLADQPKPDMLKLVLDLAVLLAAVSCLILYLLPIKYTQYVVGGTIIVNADSRRYYQFTVPPHAFNVEVTAYFSVSGGSGNDIMVYIMDDTNLFNWKWGSRKHLLQQSGTVCLWV
jgi:hypothetical protein